MQERVTYLIVNTASMAGIGAPIGLLVGGWAVENYDWQMV